MGGAASRVRRADIEGFYDLGPVVGRGGFSIVRKAIHKRSGRQVAVKIVRKDTLSSQELDELMDEVEILSKLEHPNIIKFYDLFIREKYLFIVMEFLEGGELFQKIKNQGAFSEMEAANLIRQVASAIEYCHGLGIVHRDLKPENLLFQTVEEPVLIKITDFGLAKYIGNSKTGQINVPCGTPAYMAPEVLRGESYGPQVDNWSLGVILYILLCGYPPFYQDDSIEMYDHIQRGDFDFPSPHWDFISGEAKELVRKLLTVDPQERCSLSELLNDPWLLNQNSSKPSFGEDHEKRMNMMLKQHQMNKALEIVMVAKRRHRSCSMDSIEEPPSSTDSAMKQ